MAKQTSSLAHIRSSEQGTSMLEFALVSGLFFLLILTFVDFARIYTVQALLTRGAQQAATLGTKINGFGNDIARNDPAAVDYASQLNEYRAARDTIASQAVALSSTVSVFGASTNPNSPVRILPFVPIDETAGTTTQQPGAYALVLRPGDAAIDFEGRFLHHIQRCSPATPGCPALNARQPADSMESMLQRFPITVRVQARVHTYSPFLSDIMVNGIAMAYREQPIATGQRDALVTPSQIDHAPAVDPNDPDVYDCENGPESCQPDEDFDQSTCQCYAHTCALTEADCAGLVFDRDYCTCRSGMAG